MSWSWWQNALKGDIGPIHDGHAEWGFYKRPPYDVAGPMIPCAIWQGDDGALVCRLGWDGFSTQVNPITHWTWVAKYPVSHAAYLHACRTHQWPQPDEEAFFAEIDQLIATADDGGALTDLQSRLEKKRKELKAPHLRAGKQVDALIYSYSQKIADRLFVLRRKELAA